MSITNMSVVPELAKWAGLPEDGVRAYVSKDPSSTGLILAHRALQQYAKANDVSREYGEAILQARLGELVTAMSVDRKAIEEMLKADKAADAAAAAVEAAAALQIAYEEKRRIAEEERLRAMRERRTAQNPVILKSLERHPTFRTLCHNFEEDAAMFVAYTEHRTSGKRELRVFMRHEETLNEASSRQPHKLPDSWAAHYVLGKTPFLSTCPTCGKGPVFRAPSWREQQGVACCSYKWDPATNQHFRWEVLPASAIPAPTPTPADQFMPSFSPPPAPEGRWVRWDPT